jgi:hypothetical protein
MTPTNARICREIRRNRNGDLDKPRKPGMVWNICRFRFVCGWWKARDLVKAG